MVGNIKEAYLFAGFAYLMGCLLPIALAVRIRGHVDNRQVFAGVCKGETKGFYFHFKFIIIQDRTSVIFKREQIHALFQNHKATDYAFTEDTYIKPILPHKMKRRSKFTQKTTFNSQHNPAPEVTAKRTRRRYKHISNKNPKN